MGSNRNSHSLLTAIQNSAVILEGTLVVSYPIKCALTILPSSCLPGYLLRWTEDMGTQKPDSFISNCQNLEATKTSFNGLMDGQTVLYPYNGILHSDENKWPVKPQGDMKERSQSGKLHTIYLYN